MDRLLERSTHVRGPDGDDLAHERAPHLALELGLIGAAAGDEPAHRVANERNLADRQRPRRNDLLQQVRQRAAVLRDAAAAVVADVDGGHPELALEQRAVTLASRAR